MLAASLCLCQEPAGPHIFRPADQSVIAAPLVIVARGSGKAELRLDGKPILTTQPGPSALTATLKPGPGLHELILADGGAERKVSFFVPGAANAPDWKLFKPHPPAAVCDTCHAVKDGAWDFKGATLAQSCFACHDSKPFAAAHSHNTETLAECQMCHHSHGSTSARHLKMRKELACRQCHG
ncbi:MAG: hypothetical protein HYR60_21660 [Acidobacteria bacterium]|nr:hypothetical protein [Acidobacteriota bacterium]